MRVVAAAAALAEADGVAVVDVAEAVAMVMRVSAHTLTRHDSMHTSQASSYAALLFSACVLGLGKYCGEHRCA